MDVVVENNIADPRSLQFNYATKLETAQLLLGSWERVQLARIQSVAIGQPKVGARKSTDSGFSSSSDSM